MTIPNGASETRFRIRVAMWPELQAVKRFNDRSSCGYFRFTTMLGRSRLGSNRQEGLYFAALKPTFACPCIGENGVMLRHRATHLGRAKMNYEAVRS